MLRQQPFSAVVFGSFSAAAIALAGAGCARPAYEPLDAQAYDALRVLMPSAVEIVEPFTTWADLDDASGIDGINVYVRPTNSDGDPIQATGAMYVELYAFQAASADAKGERIGVWDFPLRTQSEQDLRWRRAVQMYELPVLLPPAMKSMKPATKFVLSVTHNPPVGERRSDQYILETPLATGSMAKRP